MPFLWVTLLADSVTLVFTIYAAAKRPILVDFFIVGLAMCAFAASIHQVLARDAHLFVLGLTFVVNFLLANRLVYRRGRRKEER